MGFGVTSRFALEDAFDVVDRGECPGTPEPTSSGSLRARAANERKVLKTEKREDRREIREMSRGHAPLTLVLLRVSGSPMSHWATSLVRVKVLGGMRWDE